MAKLTTRRAHRLAMESFLDSTVGPFRRSALSDALLRVTSPRSRAQSDALAGILLRQLTKAGSIVRHGHLHWIRATRHQTLLSGRTVPASESLSTLVLATNFPGKWSSVDLSTGDVWIGEAAGWRPATRAERAEVQACILQDPAATAAGHLTSDIQAGALPTSSATQL